MARTERLLAKSKPAITHGCGTHQQITIWQPGTLACRSVLMPFQARSYARRGSPVEIAPRQQIHVIHQQRLEQFGVIQGVDPALRILDHVEALHNAATMLVGVQCPQLRKQHATGI